VQIIKTDYLPTGHVPGLSLPGLPLCLDFGKRKRKMSNTELDLDGIEARLKGATPGPWRWSQDFEGRHGEKHWCLYNPERPDGGIGDGIRRTIDYHLVTLSTSDHYCVDEEKDLTEEEIKQGKTWATRSIDNRPDFQLIANAPTDIAALVARVRELEAENKARFTEGAKETKERVLSAIDMAGLMEVKFGTKDRARVIAEIKLLVQSIEVEVE
jgi:hypothetical protein